MSHDLLLDEATKLITQGRFSEAIVKSTQSYEMFPTSKAAHLSQWSSIKLQKYSDSITYGNQGLVHLPEVHSESLQSALKFKLTIALSKAYKEQGEISTAKSILQELLPVLSSKSQIESIKSYLKQLEEMDKWTEDYCKVKTMNSSYKMRIGDRFFIVDADWYNKWEQYNSGKSDLVPGPIENKKILKDLDPAKVFFSQEDLYTHNILKSELRENTGYSLLPEVIYEKIKEKHGPVDTEIVRYCIPIGESSTQVEVTLQKLRILAFPDCAQLKKIYTSQSKLLFDLKATFRNLLFTQYENTDFDLSQIKFWKLPRKTKITVPNPLSKVFINSAVVLLESDTLEECEISPDDILLLEFPQKSGTWTISNKKIETCAHCHKSGTMQNCSKCKATKYCSAACQQSHFKFHKHNCKSFQVADEEKRGRNGLVGLQNLGNTCFMNSALQCVSNTFPLTQYFLKGTYREDLNYSNPLGTKGAALALAYADLLEDMWKGTSSLVSPWNFKKVLGKFATQFSGFQQHDSHELLSYLLTGLHEDLNKVKSKKYVEMPDLAGKPEKEAADLQWELFLDRNQSAIVDLMYGQSKSTLICPHCDKVSITFDPFLSLSVVVPTLEASVITVFIMMVSKNSQIFKHRVGIEPKGTIGRIKEYFENSYKVKFKAYVQEKFLFKHFCRDEQTAESLREGVVYMSESPEDISNYLIVPMNFSKTGDKSYSYSGKSTISFSRLLFIKKNAPTSEIPNLLTQILYKVHKENNSDKLYLIKTPRKGKNLCIFCEKKCEGCELPLSAQTTLSEIIAQINTQSEVFTFEVEFLNKTKAIDKLNKYIEEKPINLVKKAKLDINHCLDLSSQAEQLDESNKWFCGKCKDHVCASKQLKVYKLPDILILHLLRFKKKGIWTEKITTLIDFPIENLVLNSISDENVSYDLYAVSNHFGGTGGGHYTAYIKSFTNETWYEMDDSRVNSISQSQIVSSSAYILFYKKKSPH